MYERGPLIQPHSTHSTGHRLVPPCHGLLADTEVLQLPRSSQACLLQDRLANHLLWQHLQLTSSLVITLLKVRLVQLKKDLKNVILLFI